MAENEVKEEIKKSEEEILFPEIVKHGYTIKPWSFGKLCTVSEDLQKVIDFVEENDLFDSFSYLSIIKVFHKNKIPFINIICVTLDVKEEEIFEIQPFDKVFDIARIIISQNWETIKNVLSPLKNE